MAERYNGTASEFFERQYGVGTRVGKKLGNLEPGDGAKYRGRGFIQITGRFNYTNYGKRIGIDLEHQPERALEPETAARIFAAYFKDREVYQAARTQDWRAVRKRVNGGYNGYEVFIGVVNKLKGLCPEVFEPKPDFSDVEGGSSTSAPA